MGSSSHCLEGDLRMRLVTSSRVVGRRRDSLGGTFGGGGKWGERETGGVAERSLETLSQKKVAKCWAKLETDGKIGRDVVGVRWRRELIVFQSCRGLELFSEMR